MTGIKWIIAVAMVIGVTMGSVLAVFSAEEKSKSETAATDNPVETDTAILTSSSDKAEIESIIYNYLLENPHVIVKALEIYRAEQERLDQIAAEKALQENFDTLANGPYSFSVGNEDAKVTIIEFFDYNCGYCRVATPTLLKVAEENPDVRVVFKEYPIRGEDSLKVARATLAAIEQGKYLDVHRSLMKSSGKIDFAKFEKVAKRHKLDLSKIREEMGNEDIQDSLKLTYQLAQELMIEGTPSFIIGEEIVRGWPGPDNFEAMVADQLKKSAEKG